MTALINLRRLTATCILGLFTLLAPLAQAEQSIADGRYEVHYNAFNSSFLQPDVAQKNGLIRSKYRALVNVSVLQVQPDGSKKAVRAQVSGQAANLIDQAQQLDFKQITEGDAIYYIASFRFTEQEKLKLSLQVQPDPNAKPYNIQFDQTFYAD